MHSQRETNIIKLSHQDMEALTNLVDFTFDDFRVKWSGENHDLPKLVHTYSLDYDAWISGESDRLHKLRLSLRIEPDNDEKNGYTIECRITGIFVFPEDLEREKIPLVLRLNGCSILYGIIRGQTASLTGMYPAGKFTLPTMNMKEIVDVVEANKSNRDPDPNMIKKNTIKSRKGGKKVG